MTRSIVDVRARTLASDRRGIIGWRGGLEAGKCWLWCLRPWTLAQASTRVGRQVTLTLKPPRPGIMMGLCPGLLWGLNEEACEVCSTTLATCFAFSAWWLLSLLPSNVIRSWSRDVAWQGEPVRKWSQGSVTSPLGAENERRAGKSEAQPPLKHPEDFFQLPPPMVLPSTLASGQTDTCISVFIWLLECVRDLPWGLGRGWEEEVRAWASQGLPEPWHQEKPDRMLAERETDTWPVKGAGEGGEVPLPKGGRILLSPSQRARQAGTEGVVPTCPPALSLLAGGGRKTGQAPPRQGGGQKGKIHRRKAPSGVWWCFQGLTASQRHLDHPPSPLDMTCLCFLQIGVHRAAQTQTLVDPTWFQTVLTGKW